MPVARERWEFIVYDGAAVFVFTCKILVFVLMAEGWLRDSGGKPVTLGNREIRESESIPTCI